MRPFNTLSPGASYRKCKSLRFRTANPEAQSSSRFIHSVPPEGKPVLIVRLILLDVKLPCNNSTLSVSNNVRMDTPSEKEERFTLLLAENKDRIYRMCCCYVRDDDARNDVYQQTLIHIWENLDSFKGNAQLSTWIYRITVNTCLSFLRAEQRRQNLIQSGTNSSEEQVASHPADENPADSNEDLALMYSCINELPAMEKTLISLYLEEATTKEMAEVTDISESNVRVKIHRIKKLLREGMERKSHGLG